MDDASARIRLVDQPQASPGKCAICGKNEHPDGFAYIDNFDFEFYGSVIFCADCGLTIGRVFGAKSGDEVDEVVELAAKNREEADNLRQYALTLEATLDNVATLRDLRASLASDSTSSRFDLVGDNETIIESSEGSPTGESDVITEPVGSGTEQEQGPDEHANESGRNDVQRVDASIDELINI